MATAASDEDTRELLVKLCGMLGSEFEGERAVAALKITGLLQRAGWRWNEVLSLSGSPSQGEEARPTATAHSEDYHRPSPTSNHASSAGFSDWRANLACCRRYAVLLAGAELEYVKEMLSILQLGRSALRSADHARIAVIAESLRRRLSVHARSRPGTENRA